MDGDPGTLYFMSYDGLNSVSALTKYEGQSAHTYRYHDYGTILDNNDHAADSGSFTNPHNHYTYTGQEWDADNGLYHFYAREYDPLTGTWLQQDRYRGQLDSPGSFHRYLYLNDNPVNNTDLYGFCNPLYQSCLVMETHVPTPQIRPTPTPYGQISQATELHVYEPSYRPDILGGVVEGSVAVVKEFKPGTALGPASYALDAYQFGSEVHSGNESDKTVSGTGFGYYTGEAAATNVGGIAGCTLAAAGAQGPCASAGSAVWFGTSYTGLVGAAAGLITYGLCEGFACVVGSSGGRVLLNSGYNFLMDEPNMCVDQR